MEPSPVMLDPDAGWPATLVALYRERRIELVRLAYLLTGDREAAEEVVQDAFLAVRPGWGTVRDGRAYVRAAVVNRTRSWGRRRGLEQRQPALRPMHDVLAADELWDALARLSPRQRAAIVLRYYEDLPDADIARLLRVRVATVRTSVHRALGVLRKEIHR